MKPRLTELYSIEEARPGSQDILPSVPMDLQISTFSRYPWKEARKDVSDVTPDAEIIEWTKKIPNLTCVLFLMPRDFHAFSTSRGAGGAGWMVDLEIFTYGADGEQFLLHIEKPFEDMESAMAYAQKLMKFVDRSKAQDLLSVPRSGKLSMSKLSI